MTAIFLDFPHRVPNLPDTTPVPIGFADNNAVLAHNRFMARSLEIGEADSLPCGRVPDPLGKPRRSKKKVSESEHFGERPRPLISRMCDLQIFGGE